MSTKVTLKDTLADGFGNFFNNDIVSKYGPFELTIDGLYKEEVGEKREEKTVLRFSDHKKGVILNKTRCTQLSELFGEEYEGKKVRLVVETVSINNRPMDLICFEGIDE